MINNRRPTPPKTMMHFPLCFRFPLFSKNFRAFREILTILPFPRKISSFSFTKISDDLFLVIDHKFPISHPIFAVSVHFPPVSRKLFFPPTLTNFPPVLDKFTCFLHTLRVFRFPPTLTMMHLCITQCTYWTPLYLTQIVPKGVIA